MRIQSCNAAANIPWHPAGIDGASVVPGVAGVGVVSLVPTVEADPVELGRSSGNGPVQFPLPGSSRSWSGSRPANITLLMPVETITRGCCWSEYATLVEIFKGMQVAAGVALPKNIAICIAFAD